MLVECNNCKVIKCGGLYDLVDNTSKLKSLMCFMAAAPPDCAEISFHT